MKEGGCVYMCIMYVCVSCTYMCVCVSYIYTYINISYIHICASYIHICAVYDVDPTPNKIKIADMWIDGEIQLWAQCGGRGVGWAKIGIHLHPSMHYSIGKVNKLYIYIYIYTN